MRPTAKVICAQYLQSIVRNGVIRIVVPISIEGIVIVPGVQLIADQQSDSGHEQILSDHSHHILHQLRRRYFTDKVIHQNHHDAAENQKVTNHKSHGLEVPQTLFPILII